MLKKIIIAIVVVLLVLFLIVAAIVFSAVVHVADEMEKEFGPDSGFDTIDPNIIKIEIINCERNIFDDIEIESSFKNLDTSKEYRIDYKYYITDSNNNIITYDTRTFYYIEPEQLNFESDTIDYPNDWASCGIEITKIRE